MKKRILLSLVSFFAVTAMWASLIEAYQVYVTAGANGKQGEKATLTLNLKNKTAIMNATFNVVLPEGVSFVDGSAVILPARFPEGFDANIKTVVNADGTVSFTIEDLNESGLGVTNTDGEIATFEVEVASDAPVGEVTILVKDATMTDVTKSIKNYKTREDTWTIEEADNTPGDVNGDGTIDIADGVQVLNVMADGTNDPAADVNGDGVVDVADFVTVLNIMAEQ